MELSPIKLAVAVGSLALSLTAGAGTASADPNLDSAVNTTCSYNQVMAALTAQDARASQSPMAQSALRQFLAAPTAQRQRMAEAIVSYPANQQYLGLLQTAFDTCNNF
nr:hemophore-related protein [Mycolicibacterium frederiksbergense]